MIALDSHPSGRHFLQIPGPEPGARPDPARDQPADDRPPRARVRRRSARRCWPACSRSSSTRHPVVIYPASGTGAWEAALVNVRQPGDTVLMFETGHFATLWQKMAMRLGWSPSSWRMPGIDAQPACRWRGATASRPISSRSACARTRSHAIKAVCVVHNETSTGVTSDIAAVRKAIDAAGHPALLHGRHDLRPRQRRLPPRRVGRRRHHQRLAEGADAAARASASTRCRRRRSRPRKTARLPKAYWAWDEMLEMNRSGYWPVHARRPTCSTA